MPSGSAARIVSRQELVHVADRHLERDRAVEVLQLADGHEVASRASELLADVARGRAGSGRMSTSTVASPGMTLYFIPAWMTSGLNVSRMTARRIRAWIGSHSAPIASLGPARIVARRRVQEPSLVLAQGAR